MNNKVTILTRVYNTKQYVQQCISSVLTQSYSNFEYILVDNGCTDGSSQIIADYAAADKRIHLVRFEKNCLVDFYRILEKHGVGNYITILDSDDWWEPDYLKNLMELAVKTDADIVSTGTMMHMVGTNQCSERKAERRLVLEQRQFAGGFPMYHAFFRTVWAKLIRAELYMTARVPSEKIKSLGSTYGTDTLDAFTWLRQAKRICLDNSILHHYRVHKKSSSFQYDSRRFISDIYLYHDAIDFLSAYGPISGQNRYFLQCVYANAVADTAGVLSHSDLPPADKLRECRAIATHPLTQAAYRENTQEGVLRSRACLLQTALQAGAALESADDPALQAVMQTLSPRCGPAVSSSNAPLFLKEPALLRALLQDNPEPILEDFLARLEQNRGIKKYAVAEAVRALAVDNLLLCQISDTAFLRKYAEIYRMTWRGETLPALDMMTGLLLENRVTSGKETFLQLYVSLAALENQAPAFVFGKLQLAKLYLRQHRREECCAVADELVEMGLDNEELTALRQELERTA